MYKIFLIGLILMGSLQNLSANKITKKDKHVLVIGLDGLGAHGIGMVAAPHFQEIIKAGAFSLDARTVMPSSSGPAWSSIITGTTVDRHGVGNNSWTVDKKNLEPVYKGDYNMFPTIFGEIRKHKPKAEIGAVYHWESFGNFMEKDVCNYSQSATTEEDATRKACSYLAEKHPDFLFVHLDLIDHAGHHGGYRSAEYTQAILKADSLVGIFFKTLKEQKMMENTVVFIVSDHGGLDKKHGGSSPDEMIVPFFIYGNGVKKGYTINHPVFNYDLAPTVSWLFGFKLNPWTTGKPLNDAFLK